MAEYGLYGAMVRHSLPLPETIMRQQTTQSADDAAVANAAANAAVNQQQSSTGQTQCAESAAKSTGGDAVAAAATAADDEADETNTAPWLLGMHKKSLEISGRLKAANSRQSDEHNQDGAGQSNGSAHKKRELSSIFMSVKRILACNRPASDPLGETECVASTDSSVADKSHRASVTSEQRKAQPRKRLTKAAAQKLAEMRQKQLEQNAYGNGKQPAAQQQHAHKSHNHAHATPQENTLNPIAPLDCMHSMQHNFEVQHQHQQKLSQLQLQQTTDELMMRYPLQAQQHATSAASCLNSSPYIAQLAAAAAAAAAAMGRPTTTASVCADALVARNLSTSPNVRWPPVAYAPVASAAGLHSHEYATQPLPLYNSAAFIAQQQQQQQNFTAALQSQTQSHSADGGNAAAQQLLMSAALAMGASMHQRNRTQHQQQVMPPHSQPQSQNPIDLSHNIWLHEWIQRYMMSAAAAGGGLSQQQQQQQQQYAATTTTTSKPFVDCGSGSAYASQQQQHSSPTSSTSSSYDALRRRHTNSESITKLSQRKHCQQSRRKPNHMSRFMHVANLIADDETAVQMDAKKTVPEADSDNLDSEINDRDGNSNNGDATDYDDEDNDDYKHIDVCKTTTTADSNTAMEAETPIVD